MDQATLRSLQLKEFEMLCDVADFCEKHQITFYLSSGTLIGAVRHQGFIPWDDDIDITMFPEDYKRFLELAPAGLGEKYFVQCPDTDEYWYRDYTRVRMNNTTMMKPDYAKVPMHHGIWLDIFVLINTSKGFDTKLKRFLVNLSTKIRMDYFVSHNPAYQKKHPLFSKAAKLLALIPFGWRKAWQSKIIDLLLKGKGDCYSELWNTITNNHPQAFFEGEKQYVMFEGRRFEAYPGYDKILRNQYGDYMQLPPVDKRKGHDDNMIVDFDKHYTEYLK